MHRDLQSSNVWWVRPHSVFTWWPLSFHSLLHSESVKFSSARGTTFCTKTDMQNLIRSARLNWESFNKWQTDLEVLRKFINFCSFPLGTYHPTKTDELSEKFQGGGHFQSKDLYCRFSAWKWYKRVFSGYVFSTNYHVELLYYMHLMGNRII